MRSEKRKRINKQGIFCLISVLFILGCCVFYGYRLVKFYKVFNPKSTSENTVGLLSVEIPKKSTLVTEGDGLYRIGGAYIYKGNVQDNYIKYSGLLFRILKINYGSTTQIVLDSKINILAYGKDNNYKDSDINAYLNNEFIKYINKDKLDKISVCTDTKDDISNQECKKEIEVYSAILDANTFLNTVNDKTFLNSEGSLIYLRDKINKEVGNVIANGSQISYIDGDESYDIKPMLSLSYDTKIISGTGTIDDPYIVDDDNYNLSNIVTLGDNEWIIIKDDKDSLTLALNGTINNLKPYGNSFNPTDEQSIAYYLNNEFLNSLSCKDEILDTEWEIGNYINNYKDIEKEKVTAKVGMLSIKDFKMDNQDAQYLLLNKASDDEVYVVDSNMYKVDKFLSKSIRPVIRVKQSTIQKCEVK